MTGHSSSIYSLAFSAESSLLVSGGADWTVRCWDVKGSGGLRVKPRENGIAENGNRSYKEEESLETYVVESGAGPITEVWLSRTDLLSTFPTKRTPITNVQFTPRNLCLVGGTYLSPEPR